MSAAFNAEMFADPVYKQILGIEETKSISDWYALLGVNKFESDDAKITQAMQQRFELVRRYQVGNYEVPAQRLLDEMGRAHACLTNRQMRLRYNETLGDRVVSDRVADANESVNLEEAAVAIAVPAEMPAAAVDSADAGEFEAPFDSTSEVEDAGAGEVVIVPTPRNNEVVANEGGFLRHQIALVDRLLAVHAGEVKVMLRYSLRAVLVFVLLASSVGAVGLIRMKLQLRTQRELKILRERWTIALDTTDEAVLLAHVPDQLAFAKRQVEIAESRSAENELEQATILYDVALRHLANAELDAMKVLASRLEAALTQQDEPVATELLAEIESLRPKDSRLTSWQKKASYLLVTNSIGMQFKRIPAGEFEMGSQNSGGVEKPVHRVRITRDYRLGVTEVTQGQWEAVMGTHPWKGHMHVKEEPNYPATYVSWEDALQFCERLSAKEDLTYRLPTEAEWEYACRAGTATEYNFGDDPTALKDYAWFEGNASYIGESYAHEVGTKRPNPWGLYDMHGNVSEWCQDWYGGYESLAAVDPAGPSRASLRVRRGGGWRSTANFCRAAIRRRFSPTFRSDNLGFRVVLVPPSE